MIRMPIQPSTAVVRIIMLATLASATTSAAHEIEEDGSSEHPKVIHAVEAEVQTLIREFRVTGDDHSLDIAWSLLTPKLTDDPDAMTLVQAATVAQARHNFVVAKRLIDRALDAKPDFDQAWLLLASVELVLGRPQEASKACKQLLHVPLSIIITCRARVAIAEGESARALKLISALLQAVDAGSTESETLAWSLSVAGDAAAALGQEQAIEYYTESLAIEESTQVRAALVDQLIEADRLDDARLTLSDGHDALPLVVRQFVVERRLGCLGEFTEAVSRADHQFRHWIADEDFAHAREMARFYLDVVERPDLARKLATINLSIQKEPEDVLLAKRGGI